ncbi:MAG TPA: hypothetical protein PK413_14150, partial [Thermoanaerobaculia bacterium]|nr:hypothetical protein [Thermoanaerobaculia bacterium]
DQRFQKVLGNATFTESYRYAAKAGVVKLDSSRDRPEGREILVLPRRLSPGFTWTLHYFDGDETHRVDNTSLTWTIEGKPLSCVLISFDGIRSNRPMHGHEVYCPGWGMVEEEQQHGNTHLLIRLRGARPGGSGQESKVQPQGSRPPG